MDKALDAARAATFAATDGNGDGQLDLAEYTAEFAGRLDAQRAKVREAGGRQAGVRFGALDSDKDGQMTFAEYQVSLPTITSPCGRLEFSSSSCSKASISPI